MMYSCMYNHQTPLPPLSLQRESYNQQTVVAWPKGQIFYFYFYTKKKNKKTKVTQSEMFSRLVDRVPSFFNVVSFVRIGMLASGSGFLLTLSEITILKGFHWEVSRGFAAMWFIFDCRYRSIEEIHILISFKKEKKRKKAIAHLKRG